jgi:hypothetical protein
MTARLGPLVTILCLTAFGVVDARGDDARDGPATGPLRVLKENPRYFTDGSGKAIYLTGSHTWNNLQDMGPTDPPPAFDFAGYLDFLVKYHHNFIRMWRWELPRWTDEDRRAHYCTPHPWKRTKQGKASDGKPKFDLTRFDPDYFARLRLRVTAARDRGVYVSIMLFEGWGMQFSKDAWKEHPFHPDNNVNQLGGVPASKGLEVFILKDSKFKAVQEAYVKKVIDTLSDLDNVLYEISNENGPYSTEWQYHMVKLVKEYERTKTLQHPVGMTFQYQGGKNQTLMESPADWISPNPEGGYQDDPPAADGKKVILSDTDHLWGVGGDSAWVWKSFLRELNPIYMDPYADVAQGKPPEAPHEPVRRSMGQTRRFAERMNLAATAPRDELASSRYCFADPGREYLVYLPAGGRVTVDLSKVAAIFAAEWFHPGTGETKTGEPVRGGGPRMLTSPFGAGDAVLYLKAAQ